jgi:hypothetical protein
MRRPATLLCALALACGTDDAATEQAATDGSDTTTDGTASTAETSTTTGESAGTDDGTLATTTDSTPTTTAPTTTTEGLTEGTSTTDTSTCQPGEENPCYTGDPAHADVGNCKSGVAACEDGEWGACVGDVMPAAETCESPGDDDCDGVDPCAGDGAVQWHKEWGDVSDQRALAVAFDPTGAVLVLTQGAGASDFGGGPLASAGSYDVYLAKFAADGAHEWSKSFGDPATQLGDGWGLDVDASGDIVIAGDFTGTVDFGGDQLVAKGDRDVFLAKLSSTGEHVWSASHPSTGTAVPRDLAIDASGAIAVVGYFTLSLDLGGGALSGQSDSLDAFVAKFTPAGEHAWSFQFGDDTEQDARAVAVDGDGNVYVGGSFQGSIDPGIGPLVSAGSSDVFLAKLDPDGVALWAASWGDAKEQKLSAIGVDPQGRVTASGHFVGALDFGGGPLEAPMYRGFVAQFAAEDGAHAWSKLLGEGIVWPAHLAVDDSGTLVIAGHYYSDNDFGGGVLPWAGMRDAFAVKYTSAGSHVWSKHFGDATEQEADGVDVRPDGTTALSGGFYGAVDFDGAPVTSKGLFDGFVAVFAP